MSKPTLSQRIARLPCWSDPEPAEPLGGGITNQNFTAHDGAHRYVVRAGDDIPVHGILRWHELAVSRAAHGAGIAPRVHHHEPGFLVLDYLDARTYTEADVRNSDNFHRIIDLIAKAHRTIPQHLRGPALAFWVFQVIRDYAATLREGGSVHAGQLPDFLTTAEKLESAIGPVEVIFGHNDLLAANILDDGTRLWLVDWEYAGFNSPLFDLAGLASNNGLNPEQEAEMLERYFEAPPGAARWRAYAAMKCASLMRETLWSMVSEIHSSLDFDYAAYTAENLARLNAALADFRNR